MVPELTSPIAQGRTAEIYPWGNGKILKLYFSWCPSNWVEYEARVAAAIHQAGIPTPAASEIVEVNGRRGLVYERVDGVSMLQQINEKPWLLFRFASMLAEIQYQIHQRAIPGLLVYRASLRHSIEKTPVLSDVLRQKTLAALENLPDGESVCHGDFHPGNIVITTSGLIVIDWMTAKSGDAWADVARTYLLLTIGPKGAGKMVRPATRLGLGFFYRAYLRRYRALSPNGFERFQAWLPVMAAARLEENILPERELLLKMIGDWAANQ